MSYDESGFVTAFGDSPAKGGGGSASGAAGSAFSLAGAGLQAYGQLEQGEGKREEAYGAAAGFDYRAQRSDIAAEYADLAADQTGAQALERLNITLGNIDALRAASGVDPSSPTSAALRDRTEQLGLRDMSIRVGNLKAQADQDRRDSTYFQSAAASAIRSGNLAEKSGETAAGGTVLKAVGAALPMILAFA